ncbi:AAA domain-containing protein [Myroides sp. LJL115]
MKDYLKLTKYWRNSLVDQKYGQGKFTLQEVADKLITYSGQWSYFVDSKAVLARLIEPFKEELQDYCLMTKAFEKANTHLQKTSDLFPEVFYGISLKVGLSSFGFIYPLNNPTIARDLLAPLDKEDFCIGKVEDYDYYVVEHKAPEFTYSKDNPWEKAYKEHIEKPFIDGLFKELVLKGIVPSKKAEQTKDKTALILHLYKFKSQEFLPVYRAYCHIWDQNIPLIIQDNTEFLEAFEEYESKWREYDSYLDALFSYVVKDTSILQAYHKVDVNSFYPTALDASVYVVPVYEDISSKKILKSDLLLYKNYASLLKKQQKPLIDTREFFDKRVGHNNNIFPLAKAQALAVSTLHSISKGEVLPVNGPPGTGKTTMVLSVVASLWVEHALKQMEPPIIVASSTNNQAVTNILDAFSKDFSTLDTDLHQRWLVDVDSFGSYFPSKKNKDAAQQKGYMGPSSFKDMETPTYFEKAKEEFLNKASVFLKKDDLSLQSAKEEIFKKLKNKHDQLIALPKSYEKFCKTKQRLSDVLGVTSADILDQNNSILDGLVNKLAKINQIDDLWQEYLAQESVVDITLSFVGAMTKKRNAKARVYAKKHQFDDLFDIKDLDVMTMDESIEDLRNQTLFEIQQLEAFKALCLSFEQELKEVSDLLDVDSSFEKIDQQADCSIRFDMFWIASHYWEARWLLEMEELIKEEQLKKIHFTFEPFQRNQWTRRMKVTPIAVMTCFMLPDHFSFTRNLNHNNPKADYLYDFIDLLIIDEAGQVASQVAGASFAFAKKALVIGDSQQIAPITTLTQSVDIGNLHDVQLIDKSQSIRGIDQCYRDLQDKGITALKGSAMGVCQEKTPYIAEENLEPGLYLYEHRRCYDSIISFSNELCYQGILQPKRGEPAQKGLLPSMGYLHIDGKCTFMDQSRVNYVESKIIAGWIINNYFSLLEAYPGKRIKDIIAVVTPFKQQSLAIYRDLQKASNKEILQELSTITVGTVHSLQGAERDVIIFSPTYSVDNNGNFINSSPSMLNVAVSRAKDSFLVFGDMNLFDSSKTTPMGILAKYLFNDSDNELNYKHQYNAIFAREDLLQASSEIYTLADFKEHDTFLKKMLQEANKRIVIISPWLKYTTIKNNDYTSLLSNTSLDITIYTDRKFNTYTNNQPCIQKQKEFDSTLEQLKQMGVQIVVVNNIHSKIVIKDDNCLCMGSFNWFSANRNPKLANKEHSLVYYGQDMKTEIEQILQQLV